MRLDLSCSPRFHEQMENIQSANDDVAPAPCARPDVTASLTRGVSRLFRDLGLAPMAEFRLPNGRRADMAGLCPKGRLVIAEIKSCEADFAADEKWEDYLGFCDAFYFAVNADFPRDLLPDGEGLIIADGFGGAIVRDPVERSMAAARRKAITLRFARQAAARTAFILEEMGK
ncbi:MAG: MmcB family DNA repair protein [Parvularculaceae bacterium]